MTNSFLNAFLEKVLEKHASLRDLTFILPSERAALEIKKLLSELHQQPLWLPEFLTLNKWKERISGLFPAESIELYLILYDAYRTVLGKESQDFGQFLGWANILLNDFNEIDNQLLECSTVFRDLRSYAEIEHFSFLSSDLSEKQRSYKKFWDSLEKIYETFSIKMVESGLGNTGLIGRQANQNIDSFLTTLQSHLVFAGFNVLSTAEEQLIKKAIKAEKAEIFFDSNFIYTDLPNLKAGYFLRKEENQSFGILLNSNESVLDKDLNLTITRCTDITDQARYVVEELRKVSKSELNDTAIILMDEAFLVPLLNVLPNDEFSPNITMGLKTSDSLFFDWFNEKLENPEDDQSLHPFIQKLSSQKEFDTSDFKRVDPDQFLNLIHLEKNISSLKTLLEDIASDDYDLKQAWLGSQRILEICMILRNHESETVELGNLKNLLLRSLNQISLNTVSDKQNSVQIMGFLETRVLGFKNLILCSMLEEFIPGETRIESFIPFEIRSLHKLPNSYQKEAAFAYGFYRLLHDAKNVGIVYYDKDSAMAESERSRYITQLAKTLHKENPRISISEKSRSVNLPSLKSEVTEIFKDAEVLNQIKEYLRRGISASSINRYFDDQLEWYYGHVLRLKEPERDPLDVAGFGSIIHLCLENLYKPFKNELISIEVLDQLERRIEGELRSAFVESLESDELNFGARKVNFEIGKQMISNYINVEKQNIVKHGKKQFIDGERWLRKSHEFNLKGQRIQVNFRGQVDKIERVLNEIRIVDYKTGVVQSNKLELDDWTLDSVKKKPKALQLFFYQWMAKEEWPSENISGQIISLPTPSNTNLFAKVKKGNPEFSLRIFEELLEQIFNEMLNPDVLITKNPKFEYPVFETEI